MKIKKSVKIFSLAFLVILCMGIAMSIDRVGEGDDESGPAAVDTEEKSETTAPVKVKEEQTDTGVDKEEIPDFPVSDSYSFLKTLMALAFVLGLIFLTAFLFKKLMGINSAGLRSNRVPIHMVGNLPLGDKKFLSIVEIQEKHFFVGITQNSINLLSELELEIPQDTGIAGNEDNRFENIFKKARSILKNQEPVVRMNK